uniref:VWFC domain-containing protein n=1 Tax=Romanomermis culicivorax TaxID=13658 RepID=A0A915IST6_ROMCU
MAMELQFLKCTLDTCLLLPHDALLVLMKLSCMLKRSLHSGIRHAAFKECFIMGSGTVALKNKYSYYLFGFLDDGLLQPTAKNFKNSRYKQYHKVCDDCSEFASVESLWIDILVTAQPQPPTDGQGSRPGDCLIDGEVHRDGERFQLRCSGMCTCSKGNIGCSSMCPPFIIPDHCRLQKTAGSCCNEGCLLLF